MAGTELLLIRHAPSDAGGGLAGRRDVPASLPAPAALAQLRARLGPVTRLVSSPALRCRQTAEALFPDMAATLDARLWEQDFGTWEGLAPADLPDLGPLDRAGLSRARPPEGESFADLHARTAPALRQIAMDAGGPVAVVAHAGTVRVALSLALGVLPTGLAFEIAPLSLTRLRALPGAQWSVAGVNLR